MNALSSLLAVCAMTMAPLPAVCPPLPASVEYDQALGYDFISQYPKTVQLPQFDPGLGTLTMVEVRYMAAQKLTAGIESQHTSPQSVHSTIEGGVSAEVWQGSNFMGVDTLEPSGFAQAKLDPAPAYDGTLDFAGTSGLTDVDTVSETNPWYEVHPSKWGPFQGTGNVSFSYELYDDFRDWTFDVGFSGAAYSLQQVGGRVWVRYTYN